MKLPEVFERFEYQDGLFKIIIYKNPFYPYELVVSYNGWLIKHRLPDDFDDELVNLIIEDSKKSLEPYIRNEQFDKDTQELLK